MQRIFPCSPIVALGLAWLGVSAAPPFARAQGQTPPPVPAASPAVGAGVVETELPKFNVTWDSPSKDVTGAMPIGNGRVTALVWAEADGDLRVSLAMCDMWDENARSIKLGNLRFSLKPNPSAAGQPFVQTLDYKNGEITLKAGGSPEVTFRIWIDANAPLMHVEARGTDKFDLSVASDLWRTKLERPTSTPWQDFPHVAEFNNKPGPPEVTLTPDVVISRPAQIGWYHRNETSQWDATMANQSVDAKAFNVKDPLTHRTAGVLVQGAGLVLGAPDKGRLASRQPATAFRVDVACETLIAPTAADWQKRIDALAAAAAAADIEKLRAGHQRYWSDFWNRSYVFVSGDEDAKAATAGWIEARYLIACQGRAEGPVQFNGGMFGFENDKLSWHDYTQFNQRFAYWSSLPSGDFDLMQPYFAMNVNSIPVNRAKAKAMWGHEGFILPEHMIPYGPQSGSHYGWNRQGKKPSDLADDYTRQLYTATPEIAAMMLDYFEYAEDPVFVKEKLLPFANGVLTWHDRHWKKENGKLVLQPIYSGEGDRGCLNDIADVAALTKVVDGLLALPSSLSTIQDRNFWTGFRAELPPLPITRGRLNTAENLFLGVETNNQNLYPIYPLRLFGYGKPDLPVAVDSYHDRKGQAPRDGKQAWRHDATHAAYLGLADEAKRQMLLAFQRKSYRYPGFLNGDPDGQHSIEPLAIGKTALQAMLLHPGAGNKVTLLNAWPKGWDAKFKLWAPHRTSVQGTIEGGQVKEVNVLPATRRADLVVRQD